MKLIHKPNVTNMASGPRIIEKKHLTGHVSNVHVFRRAYNFFNPDSLSARGLLSASFFLPISTLLDFMLAVSPVLFQGIKQFWAKLDCQDFTGFTRSTATTYLQYRRVFLVCYIAPTLLFTSSRQKKVFFTDFFTFLFRLNVVLPPLPEVQCSNFLDFLNSWGKIMERSGLRLKTLLFKKSVKSTHKTS